MKNIFLILIVLNLNLIYSQTNQSISGKVVSEKKSLIGIEIQIIGIKQKAVTEFETTGQNFMIDADKLHITSVVYNLLDNALKYSKENPHITIKLIRQAAYFELRVSDKGIGIPEAYRSKIFEQFFRVPSGDRHNTKGYGLGLSYVNHIISKHHGFIEVESELGKGSQFAIGFYQSRLINQG